MRKLNINEYLVVEDEAAFRRFAEINSDLTWRGGFPLLSKLENMSFPEILLRRAANNGTITRLAIGSRDVEVAIKQMYSKFPEMRSGETDSLLENVLKL